MKVDTWDWGFTFLCPHCRTWTAYQQPRAQPKYLSYTLSDKKPQQLLARFDCQICGTDLEIEVAELAK